MHAPLQTVMLLTSSSKQFRLRAPGSQVVARDQFASCESMTSRSSRLDCVVCHFYYGQAIESTATVAAVVAMPLVLPPTVLGFYLLVALGPEGIGGPIAGLWGGRTLAFTFQGLVIGSVFYSLPFVVQPIRNAFQAMGDRPLEAAATLRASPRRAFWTVAVPLARPGFLTGAVLGFAHTVGEFGVVLMIGGNIPGTTKVLSVAIYDYVETSRWREASILAGGMRGLHLSSSSR